MQLDEESPRPAYGTPEHKLLKSETMAAMAKHLQEHGDDDWNSLREHPKFAPLIGGKAGRRNFDRFREKIRMAEVVDKTRPHEGREARDANREKARAAVDELRSEERPTTRAEAFFMASGASGYELIDFAGKLREMLAHAELLLEACLGKDSSGKPQIEDRKEFRSALREQRETLKFIAELSQDLLQIDAQQAFVTRLCEHVDEVLVDHPEQRDALKRSMADLLFSAPVQLLTGAA